MPRKPVNQIISPKSIPTEVRFGSIKVWNAYTLAPHWFRDARHEAEANLGGKDIHNSRREIVFTVCFAESYLFEWVRDDVLKPAGKIDEITKYFPAGARRGVDQKYKEIPVVLCDEGLLGSKPDFGGPHGVEWNELLDARDGIMHAAVSRPDRGAGQAENEKPVPSTLQKSGGWALRIVMERVKRLHAAQGTPTPPWLILGSE